MKIKILQFLNYKKEAIIIFFLIAVSVITIYPMFHSGLIPTHDGEYHVIRAYEFDKTLRDGSFYPRWLPDLNYGYGTPLLNYYYPLPYYATSFIHFFGVSFIDAFKLSLILATIIGTVSFYAWSRIFWGSNGGIIASVFYTFSPYHIVELYVRGAVGEAWALAFFPAFLWSITKVIKDENNKFVPMSALFFVCTIFSHNILAIMFIPFALSYIGFLIYNKKNKKYIIYNVAFVLLIGFSATSVFWLPALTERKYVEGLEIYDIKNNFPELYQLLIPSWGTGFSGSSVNGEMSFQIGVANLLAVFVSFFSIIWLYKKRNGNYLLVGFFLLWFIIVFFLLQKISLPIWQYVPLMNYFQFPWRFLALEIFIASFLAGSIFSIVKGIKGVGILVAICVFTIGLSIGYIQPAYYLERNDDYYYTRSNFIDGTNTPGNFFNTIWFNKSIKNRKQEKIEILSGNAVITKKSLKATSYKFNLEGENAIHLRIHTAYFPGWEAFIDGSKTSMVPDTDGLLAFSIPKGKHSINVEFNDTFPRIIGKIVSLVSFFVLLFSFVIRKHSVIIEK